MLHASSLGSEVLAARAANDAVAVVNCVQNTALRQHGPTVPAGGQDRRLVFPSASAVGCTSDGAGPRPATGPERHSGSLNQSC